MKKQLVFLILITIFAFVGCKDNDVSVVLKEKETQNEKSLNQVDLGEKDPIQGKITDEKMLVDGQLSESKDYETLKNLLSKKWVESYKSPRLIPIDTLYDKNLFETIWYVDKELEGCTLMFFDDRRYLLALNRFGEDVIGNYEIIDDDTIKLVPKVFPYEGVVYPEYCDEMTLSLNRDPKNIEYSDMLIQEGTDEVFYSLFSPTKVNTECLMDGYEVIKTDDTDYIIMDRTILKENPGMNYNNKKINYTYEVNYFRDDPRIMLQYYTPEELNPIFENLDGFLKGMTVTTLARTKDKYQVDGMKDYWYYVSYYYYEGVFYEGWVYGGYLETVDEGKIDDYLKIFMKEIDSFL